MRLLYILWLCATFSALVINIQGYSQPSIISRPNVGIFLKHVGSKHFMPSYWHHTIAVPISMERHQLKLPSVCQPQSKHHNIAKCISLPERWKHLMFDSEKLASHLIDDININEQTIRDVISMEIGRQKRG